jgi:hypothetical protein
MRNRWQRAARGLKAVPFVPIKERGNRNQFALVKTGQRCIDHVTAACAPLSRSFNAR